MGWGLTIGDDYLGVTCWRSSVWKQSSLNIQAVLGIDNPTDGIKVNKDNYLVFDQNTRTNGIDTLYSQSHMTRHPGWESIGFSNNEWYYEFSFSNPEQTKNQDTFVISVSNPITN